MAINDIAQLSVQGNVSGQNHVHTLHFKQTAPELDEQTLINLWQLNCRTAYRAIFTPNHSPVQLLTARQVCGSVPLRAPAQEVEAAGNIAGTVNYAGGTLPAYVASVISIRTANAGKSYRGRNYLGGVMGDNNNAGLMNVILRDAIVAYYNTLLSAFVTNAGVQGFQWFVFSPKLAAVPGTQCQNAGSGVTTFIVRPTFGTMRSRKIGHGT